MIKVASQCAHEKKARRPRLLDVAELTSYTRYLLLLSATSDRHARAMAEHITRELRKQKSKPLGVEGMDSGQWVLLDFGELIVHIFQEDSRDFYDLDGLWLDAKRLELAEDEDPEPAP